MYNQTKSEKKNKKNAKKVLFHSVFVKSDKHSGIYIKEKGENPYWISTLFLISSPRIYFP